MSTDLPYPSPYPHLMDTNMTLEDVAMIGVGGVSQAMATNVSITLMEINNMIEERSKDVENVVTARADLSKLAQIVAVKSALEASKTQTSEFQRRVSHLSQGFSESEVPIQDQDAASNDLGVSEVKLKRKRRTRLEMLELRAKGLVSPKRQKKQNTLPFDLDETLPSSPPNLVSSDQHAQAGLPSFSIPAESNDVSQETRHIRVSTDEPSDTDSSVSSSSPSSQSVMLENDVANRPTGEITSVSSIDNDDVVTTPIPIGSSNLRSNLDLRDSSASLQPSLLNGTTTHADIARPIDAEQSPSNSSSLDTTTSESGSDSNVGELTNAIKYGEDTAEKQTKQDVNDLKTLSSSTSQGEILRIQSNGGKMTATQRSAAQVDDSQPPMNSPRRNSQDDIDSVDQSVSLTSRARHNMPFVPETQGSTSEENDRGVAPAPLNLTQFIPDHDMKENFLTPQPLSPSEVATNSDSARNKPAPTLTLLPPDSSFVTQNPVSVAPLDSQMNGEIYESPSQPAIDELLQHLASPEQSFALTQLAVSSSQQDAKAAKRAARQERKLSAKQKVLAVTGTESAPPLSEKRQKLQSVSKDRLERAKQRAKAAKPSLRSSQKFVSSPTPADQDALPLVARPFPNGPTLTQPSPTPLGRMTRSRSPVKN
ncbi:protein of unknown function [Taphrina deformans PYCC 5710]|uniref:Uncharacterized protein n=1 Tax=Taphrina deformans (strain PYCC 5710 / ATCC 11124 / CBS 356.35 / IMI 108563 / JCM 9778 / NBRC 8474) TaxID=1097556 RepID=R4XGX3_TAPDE|nr:protein of unknown function [Taphrina deformans PYCC 5710]|eukprot:CCG83758.1 protein of unknown function [Taphrina deformans PYCC 5710]